MVWDLTSQRMMKSRDVIFHEDDFPGLGSVGRKTLSEWEEWEEVQETARNILSDESFESQVDEAPDVSTGQPENVEFCGPHQTTPDKHGNEQLPPHTPTPSIRSPSPSVPSSTPSAEHPSQDGTPPPSPSHTPVITLPSPEPPRRGTRLRKQPERYGFLVKALQASGDPETFNRLWEGWKKMSG